MTAVELRGVEKRFGDVTALRGIDLTVESGEVVGLAGPNGSGKSTTLDVMLGFTRPTDGTVRVFGEDVADEATAVRHRIGAVPDRYAVYDRLSGREHVEFVAALRGVDVDPRRTLERVGLADHGEQSAETYSNGMTQRLVLGLALVGDPDLLVLDEPFTGIDPDGIVTIRELVRETVDENTAVVLSSHRLDDLSAMCDRIATLDGGSVETVRRVDAEPGESVVLEVDGVEVPDRALSAVRECDGVATVSYENENLSVTCERSARLQVLTALDDNGVSVAAFETTPSTNEPLEELNPRNDS